MSDDALVALARSAGLAVHWRDAFGRDHRVEPPTLRAVLASLGLPAETAAQIRDAEAALQAQQGRQLPPMVTAIQGQPIPLTLPPGKLRIDLEHGGWLEGDNAGGAVVLPAMDAIGYHHLRVGEQETVLAVAPPRCFSVADAGGGRRLWGLAAQLYSLRRPGDRGIGDYAALAEFTRHAARHGAAAVAISPVHAQFSADPDRFSPYAPSSRMAANILHVDPGGAPSTEEEQRLEKLDLLDWPAAARARLARLRAVFEHAVDDREQMAALAAFRRERGDALESHARFEALHAHHFGRDAGAWNWRGWDAAFRDPHSAAVNRFASEHEHEITFHAWAQWLAEQGLADAQAAARAAGMPVGLVSDLAVGTDGGGSHSWSRQTEMLIGLSVGAPPDLLSLDGQNWGLTAFSPRGLRDHGYAAFLEMLRAATRHAGGVRIDHAMGLARLWVVPEGASARDGAYLHFPFEDLIRLVALESVRGRAIVMAEDLGTVPEGFQDRLQQAAILGMRVLWFERDNEQRFTSPRRWTQGAAAMTSTHDLATVAGWWSGGDLEWRTRLGLLGDQANIDREHEARWRDRHALWAAFRDSGSATGDTPMPHDTWPAADAAARHIGGSACELAMLPLEDALALQEQPNLPGTLDTHPNWRRRLPGTADTLLDEPHVADRLRALDKARQ